jgi:hypothetical protein
MALSDRTKRGIIIAVPVLAGITSFWLAALLLVLAAALIAWGQEPKRTEEFVGGGAVWQVPAQGIGSIRLVAIVAEFGAIGTFGRHSLIR